MRKAIATILAVLCALILLHLCRNYSPIDGVQGMIWGALFHEDTVYAPDYTDSGFMQITTGMNRDKVTGILGPPVDEWSNAGLTHVRWSKSPGDTHYRRRVVVFTNNIVVEKQAEFYVD